MTLQDALEKLERAGAIRSRVLCGMVATDGCHFWRVVESMAAGPGTICIDDLPDNAYPDLSPCAGSTPADDGHDPLTVQGLLLLLREAAGRLDIAAESVRLQDGSIAWTVGAWDMVDVFNIGEFPTELAAIEAAIIAAAERVS